MLKILPMESELIFGGRCWERNRLSAILAYPSSLPWFYNNFISLFMDWQCTVTAYDPWKTSDFISVFNEIISLEHVDYTNKPLIDTLIEALSNNEYILVTWDRYFVKNSDNYLKDHLFHDALIYGFDSENKRLYFFDRDINEESFGTGVIDYKSFLDAYYGYLKTMNDNGHKYWHYLLGYPLSKFSVNHKETQINLKKILYDLYIQSVGYEYIEGYHPNGDPKIYRGGIKIFDGYTDLIEKVEHTPELLLSNLDFIQGIIWGLKYVMENKKNNYNRFEYLFNKGILIPDKQIFSDINELNGMIFEFFNLLTKYSFDHSSVTLLKCKKILPLIKEQDTKMFSCAINIISESIKKEWSESNLAKLNNEMA